MCRDLKKKTNASARPFGSTKEVQKSRGYSSGFSKSSEANFFTRITSGRFASHNQLNKLQVSLYGFVQLMSTRNRPRYRQRFLSSFGICFSCQLCIRGDCQGFHATYDQNSSPYYSNGLGIIVDYCL